MDGDPDCRPAAAKEAVQHRLNSLRGKRAAHARNIKLTKSNLATAIQTLGNWRSVRPYAISFKCICCLRDAVLCNLIIQLHSLSEHVTSEVELANRMTETSLDRFLGDRDQLLMKVVLRYFAILVAEKDTHLKQLARELESFEKRRHHTFVDRDLQVG
jgi:hypothetical protein